MKSTNLSKEQRISNEIKRLHGIFKKVSESHKKTVAGLIERCGYLRVTLEDLERGLNENGMTELFSQSDKNTPYPRERPDARQYIQLLKSYQNGTKQLMMLLPHAEPVEEEDDFDRFLRNRPG